jgi:hypothetical protein
MFPEHLHMKMVYGIIPVRSALWIYPAVNQPRRRYYWAD